MSFRITGLPAEDFAPLFDLSEAELATRGAMRRIAEARNPGTPCRISLTDAQVGEELLLVNYEHHPVASPYRMRFAVFVRKGEERYDAVDRVPEQLRLRTLAVRSFDVPAGVTPGSYDLNAAMWRDMNRNGVIDVGDQHLGTLTYPNAITVAATRKRASH